jgi:hypothetical protein
MTDTLRDIFARAVTHESPSGVDLQLVLRMGRHRDYARRTAVVAGVGAVAAATATVAAMTNTSGRTPGRGTVVQLATGGRAALSAPPSDSSAPGGASVQPTELSAGASARPLAPPPQQDRACGNDYAGNPIVGRSAAIPTSSDVAAAVRSAAPASTYTVLASGPIMESSSAGYATLEVMASVTGALPSTAAAAEVTAAACSGHTYRRSALPAGGVLLAETTQPADKDGYQVVAWTAAGVRIRASAQPWVFNAADATNARTSPSLTVAQLELIVRALAAS